MKPGHFILPNWNHDDSFVVGERKLTCTAEGWGNNSVAGHLIDFDPEHRLVKILAFSESRPLALKFNQIKRLKIDLQPDTDKDFESSELLDPARVTPPQPFVLHLRDGAIYSGIAHAHRRVPYGVWVFPKKMLEDDPFRVFLPRASVNRFEIVEDQPIDAGETRFDQQDFNDSVAAEVETLGVELAVGRPSATMVETQDQLREALDNQARLKPVPIGEALLGLGKITVEQLTEALQRQKVNRSLPLGRMLIDMGVVTPADLQTAFARKMGYPFVDIKRYPIDVAALRRVPLAIASRLKVLPLQEMQSTLVVAMPDPLQYKIIEELEFTAQRKVIPVVTTSTELPSQITRAYRGIGMVESMVRPSKPEAVLPEAQPNGDGGLDAYQLAEELSGEAHDRQDDEQQIEQSDNTLVKLINSMITEAYFQRASDIHIEPYPGREKLMIRFRVDGEMRPYLELPSSYRSALIARLKIMCDLDISERRKPQDGKINFSKYGALPIELRVATIPVADGLEDVVMRLLTSYKVLPLESLDLSLANLASLTRAIEKPYGLFLCAGPTGSGKTTTLHSVLQRLNTPNRKVWTAEDPVEITQRGLRQIQVNPRIGWTFASALRSLLRADPDVIMVGEVRDHETAEIAIEASLTGHLVLSTLHTNSAAETIVRLIDLGVDPFSFSDSLQGILAQRLVRRLCTDCVKTEPMAQERLIELIREYQAPLPTGHVWHDNEELVRDWTSRFGRDGRVMAYHAPGCERCGGTGYRSRLALHEMLEASPELRHLVQQRARPQDLMQVAMAQGMRTLRQDGIEKVLAGLTSLAEVRASAAM
jgi:type II secretory ATPase GspE/PulE/Tfp pilus assembly ATPase PilB-like protein